MSEMDGVDKVMFVVDRHDLDTQTQSEYDAFELGQWIVPRILLN